MTTKGTRKTGVDTEPTLGGSQSALGGGAARVELPYPVSHMRLVEELPRAHALLEQGSVPTFGESAVCWLHVLSDASVAASPTGAKHYTPPTGWVVGERNGEGVVETIVSRGTTLTPFGYQFLCNQISITKTICWKTAGPKLYLVDWSMNSDRTLLRLWNKCIKVDVVDGDRLAFAKDVLKFLMSKSASKAISASIVAVATAALKIVGGLGRVEHLTDVGALLREEPDDLITQLTTISNLTDPSSSMAGLLGCVITACIGDLSLEDRWLHFAEVRKRCADPSAQQRIAHQCNLSLPFQPRADDAYYLEGGELWKPTPLAEVKDTDLIPCGKDSVAGATVRAWLGSSVQSLYVIPSQDTELLRKASRTGTFSKRGTVKSIGLQTVRGEVFRRALGVVVMKDTTKVSAPSAGGSSKKRALDWDV